MTEALLCGLDVDQVLAYLQGQKDSELRKTLPNVEMRLGRSLTEVPIVIKTKGHVAYLIGTADEIIRDFPSELWKYRNKYNFGISKSRFDQYFKNYMRRRAAIIYFEEVKMIYPPLEKFPKYQTWGYLTLPPTIKTYEMSNERIKKKLIDLTNKIKQSITP